MNFWQMIVLLILLAPAVSLPYEDFGGFWSNIPAMVLGLVLATLVKK